MEENFSPELYLTNRFILEKTLDQAEKDFLSAGIELKLHGGAATFESICNLLQEKLEGILQYQAGALNNLLYRIDLSESKIKSLHVDKSEKPFSLLLAELILKRELQKVVIREYYKKNTKDKE